LTESDGYFYGRGTTDDKFMASAFVANLSCYKQERYLPEPDIVVALETDEEIFDAMGLGMRWLLANQRQLIDAEFALNEGGRVGLRGGKAIWNLYKRPRQLQAGSNKSVGIALLIGNGAYVKVPKLPTPRMLP